MTLNLSYKVRATLYALNVIGSPVMAYLLARAVIGSLEVTLWATEMTAVFLLAGLNVSPDKYEAGDK
jgi:hypothetical protein